MSLSSLLEKNTEVKSVLKETCPSKNTFSSNTPYPAFSSANPILVPYQLENNGDAGLVGTAADYMFRFIVARVLNHDKDCVLDDIVSETAVNLLIFSDKSDFSKRLQSFFNDGTKTVRRYIYGECISMPLLAEISLHLAYLDAYCRSGALPNNRNDIIDRVDPVLIKDIIALSNVFFSVFVDGHVVTPDSDVVFNPVFGPWSLKCGGADADIYIDGILYDFKCTKTMYKDWTEIGQLFGYYLLQRLCIEDKLDQKQKWLQKPIKAIAIYKGRFGVINTYKITESDAETLEEATHRFRNALQNESERQKQPHSLPFEQEYPQHHESPRMVTIPKHRNIPLSAFGYCKGDLIYHTYLGIGTIQDFYLSEDGYLYVVKYDCARTPTQGRLIDFYGDHCLICQNEHISEGKCINHNKYGFGRVLKIEIRGNLTEMHVEFMKRGMKVLNVAQNDYHVAKKLMPAFKSFSEFPYHEGEDVVIDGRIPVKIGGFKEENNTLFVCLLDKNSKEKWLRLGIAAMRLSDLASRKDV